MAMAVSKDCSFALTVSADHIVGRYDLVRHYALGSGRSSDRISFSRTRRHRLKHTNQLGRSEPSIQEMEPFPSVMMGAYAQLEAGMAGESHSSTMDGGSSGSLGSRVRLYSTKSFKLLGTLVYHKENCHALAFASTYMGRTTDPSDGWGADEDEDDMTDEEKRQRGRWLIAAGKDNRVSIWGLMSFEKGTTV